MMELPPDEIPPRLRRALIVLVFVLGAVLAVLGAVAF